VQSPGFQKSLKKLARSPLAIRHSGISFGGRVSSLVFLNGFEQTQGYN